MLYTRYFFGAVYTCGRADGSTFKGIVRVVLADLQMRPKLKILFLISSRKPSKIANDTIMMAMPAAMLIIAIFVTDVVKEPACTSEILSDMNLDTFTRLRLNCLKDRYEF
ncbi:hypothetical protein [Pontibacter sp. BAB1700]|uniref:hypothetical protein n=1 Tax=Pontibacter sp. BAB1700 TaxID=1144253 RepID=UPI001ED94BD3|nr:hypothetical protein [Pontibacter sp. BAB1700]